MTAVEALALAHATNVRVSLIGDRIRYQSRGALSSDVIEALRAAKPEIVALLGLLFIDATGALVEAGSGGDSLLARLREARLSRAALWGSGGARRRDRTGPRSAHASPVRVC